MQDSGNKQAVLSAKR